jgi:hypothetical protein
MAATPCTTFDTYCIHFANLKIAFCSMPTEFLCQIRDLVVSKINVLLKKHLLRFYLSILNCPADVRGSRLHFLLAYMFLKRRIWRHQLHITEKQCNLGLHLIPNEAVHSVILLEDFLNDLTRQVSSMTWMHPSCTVVKHWSHSLPLVPVEAWHSVPLLELFLHVLRSAR